LTYSASNTIYVFELKVNDTAQNALAQIDKRGYAFPYQTNNRKVVKVGVKMNAETRMIEAWEVGEYEHFYNFDA